MGRAGRDFHFRIERFQINKNIILSKKGNFILNLLFSLMQLWSKTINILINIKKGNDLFTYLILTILGTDKFVQLTQVVIFPNKEKTIINKICIWIKAKSLKNPIRRNSYFCNYIQCCFFLYNVWQFILFDVHCIFHSHISFTPFLHILNTSTCILIQFRYFPSLNSNNIPYYWPEGYIVWYTIIMSL